MAGPDPLEVDLALLAAETEYHAELVTRGILPEGARREPTTGELRAGVRFAELDRIVAEAVGLITRTVGPVREQLLAELAEYLADAPDPYAVLARLEQLNPRDLPQLAGVLDNAVGELADQLAAVAQAGADEALSEAVRQGVPDRLIPPVDAATAEVETAAAAHAERVAMAPVTRAVAVAAEAAQRAATTMDATVMGVVNAAIAAATEASTAGPDDVARQAANVAHGIGRREAQTSLPEPAELYASELLDRNTCGPCGELDGREYDTMAEALEDYPGAGGYVGCEGGSRCRGTLVIVWGDEAGATLDRPGFGPRGQAVDRSRRGPSGATRPAWIDDDGGILPP